MPSLTKQTPFLPDRGDPDHDWAYGEYVQDAEYLEQRSFEYIGERGRAAEQYGPGVYHRDGFSYVNDAGHRM